MFGYIFATVTFIGASQGLLLIFFLFHNKRGNQRANRYLALAIIIATITVFFEGLTDIFGVDILPFLIFYSRMIEFASGPLYYFYVCALVAPEERIRPRDCLHFIPLVVAYTAYTLAFGISKKEILSGPFEPNRAEYRVIAAISVVFFAMRNRVRRHNEKIKEAFSSIERINLRLLKTIIDLGFAFTLILLLGILAWMAIFPTAHGEGFFPIFFRGIIGVMPAAKIMLIGYNGLSQSEIFTGAARGAVDETTTDGSSARAAKGAATLLPQERLDGLY